MVDCVIPRDDVDKVIDGSDAMSGCTPIRNENGTQKLLMNTDFRRLFLILSVFICVDRLFLRHLRSIDG